MRILHVSDTHGTFPNLDPCADIIVHSGDLLPNFSRGGPEEACRQMDWIRDNALLLRAWIGGRPFLFTHGNHDFCANTADLLVDAAIDAICLDDRVHVEQHVRFYGVPWTKHFTGEWNRELHPPEMQAVINRIPPVDVLVAHGPPLGILDVNAYGEFCGCPTMRNALDYGTIPMPALYLCGHIHESHGVTGRKMGTYPDPILFSNAATTQHILEI